MRLWLDDQRGAPEGWVRCSTPEKAIAFLSKGRVRELSLGDTGYPVLVWLENQVYFFRFVVPKISFHGADTTSRPQMARLKSRIYRCFLQNRYNKR